MNFKFVKQKKSKFEIDDMSTFVWKKGSIVFVFVNLFQHYREQTIALEMAGVGKSFRCTLRRHRGLLPLWLSLMIYLKYWRLEFTSFNKAFRLLLSMTGKFICFKALRSFWFLQIWIIWLCLNLKISNTKPIRKWNALVILEFFLYNFLTLSLIEFRYNMSQNFFEHVIYYHFI